LAEEVEAGAGDLDQSERRALFPRLAAAIAGFDLPWARALVREAITLARGIEDPEDRARALVYLVGAVAGLNPGEAETLARGIPDPAYRDRAIFSAVEQMSSTDPDRADVLARSISHPRLRAWARANPAERTGILAFSEWTEVLVARLRAELGPDFEVRVT
jgi:hypothetical protein